METFLQRFAAVVAGVLHGFDRLRFRGSQRQLCHVAGALSWLGHVRKPLMEFRQFARDTTVTLCQSLEGPATAAGIYRFLNNSQVSKEDEALRLAAEHGRTEGLIAVLGCVEPCQVLQVRGQHRTKMLELRVEPGKCKHYYHYYLDPQYGLRYTRLQSWFPFTMHQGLNGRDWLAQQLTAAGIAYRKQDNGFPWISDFAAAQHLADQQRTVDWSALLDRWARESHPLVETLLPCPVPYYWSVEACEYATDVAFTSAAALARVYPDLVEHARTTLRSTDLLRFMGYRLRQDGQPRANLGGEVTTRLKELVEGVCVKHQILGNQLKMYDKFGQLVRLETNLWQLKDFKVYRPADGDPDGPRKRRRLRLGVVDIAVRAEVSQQVNERYAESLATVADKTPLADVTKELGQRRLWRGRTVRALNPLADEDVRLLEAVRRGEFVISGFRNRDLRALLFADAPAATAAAAKKQSAKVTRWLRLLQAHGLITKIAQSHRYQVSEKGSAPLSALLAARRANTQQLLQAA